MANKIDLKSMDWTAVLIDAAMQTRRSYEDSRDVGSLGPQLHDVIRAYQSENGDDDGDLDDDLDDFDLDDEHGHPVRNAEEPSQGERSEKDQDNPELVRLRQDLAVLHERLAATERRLESERSLAESTRRESAAREHELMTLLSDALRRGPVVQAPAGDTEPPKAESSNSGEVTATNPEPPIARHAVELDHRAGIAIAADIEVEVETDQVEDDIDAEIDDESDVEAGADVVPGPEVDTKDAYLQLFDSSKIIDVEVITPASNAGSPASVTAAKPPTEATESTLSGSSSSPSGGAAAESQPLQLYDKLLQADPLGRAEAALRRKDYTDARELFAALESKSRELGPEGELALITIRRGLAESCIGLRDLKSALRASKLARAAASAKFKEAPTAPSLRDYLSSTRVRGMVLLAAGEVRGARMLLQRACTKAGLCGIARSPDHENELEIMSALIKGIQDSNALKKTRKSRRRRGAGR